MSLFSERYGYTKPSDVIIREKITPEIQNAICNCFDHLKEAINYVELGYTHSTYPEIEKYVWEYFLNEKVRALHHKEVIIAFIENKEKQWYNKLDLIEFTISYLFILANQRKIRTQIPMRFIDALNYEFKRLNFAYRIIDGKIVEITSEEEIITIEEALSSSKDNIRTHLNKALELYAQKPIGDFRNSIKESISAVEAFCREKTSEDTLGKALNHLESNGIVIPKLLKTAFDKLYAYTNQPDTGIRHALMDETNAPQAEEALFMLISCSAFINYLNKKV